MKLLRKLSLIIVLTYLTLGLSLGYIAYVLMLERTSKLELSRARNNILRLKHNLHEFLNEIDKLSGDWAIWDDLFYFTYDKNEKFIVSNLDNKSFSQIKINYIFIADSYDNLVFKKGFNYREEKSIEIEDKLIKELKFANLINKPTSINDIKSGIILHGNKLLAVISRPILRSSGNGIIAGTLLFGRYLDSSNISHIEKILVQNVNLIPVNHSMPQDYKNAIPLLSAKPDTFAVIPMDDNKLALYSYIKDINGKPSIMYRSIIDRVELEIESRGHFFYISSILMLGAFFGAFLIILIYRTVLRRLNRFRNFIENFGTKNEINLDIKGNDELASLANDTKKMVSRLKMRTLELEVLSSISSGLMLSKNFYEVGHLVFSNFYKFAGISTGGKLSIYDSQKDYFYVVYDIDKEMNRIKKNIPSSTGCKLSEIKYYSGYVVKTMKTLFIEDNHSEFSLSIAPEQINIPDHSMIFFPLIFESKFVGILTFAKSGAKSLDLSFVKFLESISHFVSLTIGKLLQDEYIIQAIKGMEESEEKLRSFIEQSSEGIVIIDENGIINEWNNSMENISGIKKDDTIGKPGWESMNKLLSEEGRAIINPVILHKSYYETFQHSLDVVENSNNEMEILTPEGEKKIIQQVIFPIKGSRGFRIGSIIRDITQNKKAEQALKDSENRFRSLFEKSPTAMAITRNRTYIYVNQSFINLFRYNNIDEIVGHSVLELIAPDAHSMVYDREIRRFRNEPLSSSYESIGLKKDGTTFPYLIESAHFDLDNNPSTVIFIIDLSERKRAEDELIIKQKLESVGTLAGGIAHDFNNILTSLSGNIQIARIKGKLPPDIDKFLLEAEKASLRAKNLTKQLLTFSRGGAPIVKVCSISQLLNDTVSFSLRGSNVKYEINTSNTLRNVNIDEGQISQVIQNIVINAKQAMPMGGKIIITSENALVDSNNYLSLKEGLYVKISIRDMGMGIPEEYLSKIFDPYFTTKEEGHGLGLSVCYSIIKNHNGAIQVDSETGKGSEFTFYLPAVETTALPDIKNVNSILQGEGNILLMDDDEMIMTLAKEIFDELGYSSTIVKNGTEALAEYKRSIRDSNKYSIVILDLTIPGGMGGKEVIKELKEIDPNVKAIVASGYHSDPVMSDFQKYGFIAAIIKPFDIREMSVILNDVISRP